MVACVYIFDEQLLNHVDEPLRTDSIISNRWLLLKSSAAVLFKSLLLFIAKVYIYIICFVVGFEFFIMN